MNTVALLICEKKIASSRAGLHKNLSDKSTLTVKQLICMQQGSTVILNMPAANIPRTRKIFIGISVSLGKSSICVCESNTICHFGNNIASSLKLFSLSCLSLFFGQPNTHLGLISYEYKSPQLPLCNNASSYTLAFYNT